MLDRVLPLGRHEFRAPNGTAFVTNGVIIGREPEGPDFYNVSYFSGGKSHRGIQFPTNGSYLDPHSEYQRKFINTLDWIRSYVDEGDIIDVGTGPGHLAYWAERTQSPLRVYGCDLSIDLLRSEHNLNPSASVVGRINNIPFATEAFDGVLFSDVLEHVTPDQSVEAVLEGQRVLKPGGRIFIRIPNRETWTDAALHDEGHVWLPTPDEAYGLLEAGGFEPESIEVFTRGFPESNMHFELHGYDLTRPTYGNAICASARKPL